MVDRSVLLLSYTVAGVATLSLLPPLAIAIRHWPRLATSLRCFAGYLALELVIELASFVLGRREINNHVVAVIGLPIETALILRTFAGWQIDPRARDLLRRLSPFTALFWLPPLLGWEALHDFSLVTDSAQAILCLAAAAFTLVRRSFALGGSPKQEDWFWISGGVMLYFATYALMSPLTRYFMARAPTTAVAVLTVTACAQASANLLFTLGMRCSQRRSNSGPSISSPHSWWASL